MTEEKLISIYLTSMSVGGAQRVAQDLSKGLSECGYAVDIVLVDASGDLMENICDSVNIVNLNSDRVASSFYPLRQYLLSREPDILYSMMTGPNLIAIAAVQTVWSDIKLVISEHTTLTRRTESTKEIIIAYGAWVSYSFADHAVAVSKGVREDLLNKTRLKNNKVSTIYNPVDIELIKQKAEKPLRHEWFHDDEIDVIVSAGRHEPVKDYKTLVEAFANINSQDIRLVLLGEGSETEILKDITKRKGVDDRVLFTGFVSNPYKYMAASDVFALSSRYEGFGLVLVEAMACGCPVVSTNCESGPSEILKDGVYGPLVPVENPRYLASAIEKTLAEPPNMDMLIQRASDFSVENAIRKYEYLFRNILD